MKRREDRLETAAFSVTEAQGGKACKSLIQFSKKILRLPLKS